MSMYPGTRRSLVCLLLLSAVLTISALDLTVEYVDGYLDVQDGNEWLELVIGETISDDDVVRLDDYSIAELSAPGIKLTLTSPGIYRISELIEQSGRQRTIGLASVVGGKVAALFSDRKSDSAAAVMGVRGAQSESTVRWMTGDTAELIKSGKERLETGELDEAFELFAEAYDFAEIDEETETLFFLGYTAYLMGDLRVAAGYFGDIVEIDPEADFFPNLLLVYGQLLTETFAYEEAIDLIETYVDVETLDTATRQTALLIEGVNYQALGDTTNAKRALERSRAIAPESDIADAALAMQRELE
jgi:tetratricopeptide (TPR) repeat protein